MHDPNLRSDLTDINIRMLEDPAYSSVVRWSAEGDSFVVLEVRLKSISDKTPHRRLRQPFRRLLTGTSRHTEREVYQDYPAEAFQTQ